jgi:hypothetical protein
VPVVPVPDVRFPCNQLSIDILVSLSDIS